MHGIKINTYDEACIKSYKNCYDKKKNNKLITNETRERKYVKKS